LTGQKTNGSLSKHLARRLLLVYLMRRSARNCLTDCDATVLKSIQTDWMI